jgi:hypothetical protein
MALVKCKECGLDVSTGAKSCPKCGATVPKKTSLFTWLVLLLIVFIVYAGSKAPSTPKIQNATPVSDVKPKSESAKKAEPPKPSWVTSTSKDKMTGALTAFAFSPEIKPSQRMDFPYHDVISWMGVGCDSKNEWVFFGFSDSPNLVNDQTEDGYNLIPTRIRWDKKVVNVALTQDWGSKFIHFTDDAATISKISASNTVLLELQWHGQQPTYFEYSLSGSSKAIADMREKCAALK